MAHGCGYRKCFLVLDSQNRQLYSRGVSIELQTYHFFRENPLEFDDSKTVKELVQYAFDQFDYYEPLGMDIVTVYQARYAHFTQDTSKKCIDEIKDPNMLCFAYFMPGVFYFAEGGWGIIWQNYQTTQFLIILLP